MNKNAFLQVKGKKYEGFTELGFDRSIEFASGTFTFVATLEKDEKLPFKVQDECQIIFQDIPVLTGFIERMVFEYSANTHSVSIEGRDKTADIVDSTIVGNVDLKAPISLEQVIRDVVGLIGADINVINLVDGLKDFDENELVVAEIGDNAFEFIEKYARKRGTLLSTNGRGEILIVRGGDVALTGALINQINGRRNNVKAGSISYDLTNRFNKYVVRSQGNPSSTELLGEIGGDILEAGEGFASFESTEGEAIDSVIRSSRVMELQAESVSVNQTAQERAEWESNIRRARSIVYSATMANLNSVPGQIFVPNVLIQVIDEFTDINSQMLIRRVIYNFSNSGGTTVNLELVPRDAYTLLASKNPIDAQHNQVGEDVIAPAS